MQNISVIYNKLGLSQEYFIPYGKFKAKIDCLEYKGNRTPGKLILVTALNPTPAGEGKTTVSIGLAEGLDMLEKKTIVTLREPSLGPVFGLKGGATGGGKSQIEPSQDIDLHFNGDFHAITSAHNLLSSLIDNHIYHGNALNIDKVVWPRTIDISDRSLRRIQTKIRKDRFVITAASEIMAVLALCRDKKDLIKRIDKILIGYDNLKNPIYVKQLNCTPALVLLLKDAIFPNLVQTLNGVPAFIHAGPFANIAHGCSSVISTKLALDLADYVVTEAGFGADLGMEKFLNLKLPNLDQKVNVVVLVVTLRAIKSHGKSKDFSKKDRKALIEGFKHIEKHVSNIKNFGLNFVIALNVHKNDDQEEIALLHDWAKTHGFNFELSKSYLLGAEGSIKLAKKVIKLSNKESNFKKMYTDYKDIYKNIENIARNIYGAEGIYLSDRAKKQLNVCISNKWFLPVCIAKTPFSFSGDKNLIGVPTEFTLFIDSIIPSLGAGFLVVKTKGINTMPGLNSYPRALDYKIDKNLEIIRS